MPIPPVLPWCFLAMFLSVLPLRAIPLSSNSPVTLYFALYRILHHCPISVIPNATKSILGPFCGLM